MLVAGIIFVFVQFILFLASIGLLIWVWTVVQIQPVPFVPTKNKFLKVVIDALDLKPDSIFYDLGSGDGRIVWEAHRREPHAHVTGIEKRWGLWLLCTIVRRFRPFPQSVHFQNADFSDISLRDATHVYMFLLPAVMKMIEPKLKNELRGARVVVCDFPFPTLTPIRTINLPGGEKRDLFRTLYIYEFAKE